MNECPCSGCVTCACSAIPGMDEDGCCAGCGGTPLLVAALCEATATDPKHRIAPHVGSEAEGRDREHIAQIIAIGIPPERLRVYIEAPEAA